MAPSVRTSLWAGGTGLRPFSLGSGLDKWLLQHVPVAHTKHQQCTPPGEASLPQSMHNKALHAHNAFMSTLYCHYCHARLARHGDPQAHLCGDKRQPSRVRISLLHADVHTGWLCSKVYGLSPPWLAHGAITSVRLPCFRPHDRAPRMSYMQMLRGQCIAAVLPCRRSS